MDTDVVHPQLDSVLSVPPSVVAGGLCQSDGVVTNGERKESAMQGHIRSRGRQQFRVHRRCRYGAGAALSELRQTLLGRAQTQGELSFLRRQALRDRRAPPRDQGRLQDAQGSASGDEQGAGGGRGTQLRHPDQAHCARVPSQGVAAGHRGDDQTDDLQKLRAARGVPHLPAYRLGEAGEALRGGDQRLYAKLAQSGKRDGKTAASRPSPSATCTPSCTGH